MSASELKTNSPIYPGWRLDGYDYTVPDIHHWNGAMPVPGYSGARLSYWKRDIRSDYANDTNLYDAMRENGKITPYAGLVYDLGQHWSAYASYTCIFTPQSQRDVNSRFLAPLEGKHYEVGAKGEFFGGKLTTSAAVFQLKQENLAWCWAAA
ncbi:TonB-dependent receptor domain-containing protein [Janthinobacterium sp. GB4P2]|uniref:TonB-dependent receptor domain-containing protein n=1 Tax=Janthinobacterium sp. GB4P2 TaxID=3424189 RepID=UPI003F23357E